MVLPEELIILGKVAGTHGIRGELRIACYSGQYDTLMGLRKLLLRGLKGELLEIPIDSVRLNTGKALVKLSQYDDINGVKHLVGMDLVVYRSQLPELEDDEFYWHDLIGLRVLTESGEELGRLAEIFSTGSNDVYVVRKGNREYMIPALEDVVKEINLAAGTMKVSPMEGLLDL
jgi:16S rRNA processing protein RimM